MSSDGETDFAERFKRTIERRDRAIGTQRIGDLNRLFACRYGGNRESYVFPDDDAGLEDLKILLHHYALNNPLAMTRIIKLRAPWVNEATAARLLEQIEAFSQKWRADTLGRKLNFTGAEWLALRLRTIAPVDMTREKRVAYSQALARQRRQIKRRSKGKALRADWLAENNANQTKPWVALSISRRTWYRRGKPSPGTGADTIKMPNATTIPVPPSTGMGGDRGGRAGLRPAGPQRPEVVNSESS
jgi:hypothetical protein